MRTLVIDDEFVALTKMTAVLSEHGVCHAATSGTQALEMFVKAATSGQPYTLVTIDINMPHMDGYAVIQQLRLQERRLKITPARKIIVSAAADTDNVMRAARSDCDGFLVKPVSRETLLKKLLPMGLLDAAQASAES